MWFLSLSLSLFWMCTFASRYVDMNAEMVSTDNKLDIEHANVKTWNGRALPIEFYGELLIRSQQQVETLERVTCRDDNVSRSTSALFMKPSSRAKPSPSVCVSESTAYL